MLAPGVRAGLAPSPEALGEERRERPREVRLGVRDGTPQSWRRAASCCGNSGVAVRSQLAGGSIRLEMSDLGEDVRARTAVYGRGPADQIRTPAEQREDLPVPVWARLKAAVNAPTPGRTGFQRRRRPGDAVGMFPMPSGGLLAFRPCVRSTGQCFP